MQMLYFGAWSASKLGHFLYAPGGRTVYGPAYLLPFCLSALDTALLPPGKPQEQGVLHRSVINGWTIVGFWDRSADSRSGSNSSFIMEGDFPVEAVLAAAREKFPDIFARPGFPTLVWAGKPV